MSAPDDELRGALSAFYSAALGRRVIIDGRPPHFIQLCSGLSWDPPMPHDQAITSVLVSTVQRSIPSRIETEHLATVTAVTSFLDRIRASAAWRRIVTVRVAAIAEGLRDSPLIASIHSSSGVSFSAIRAYVHRAENEKLSEADLGEIALEILE